MYYLIAELSNGIRTYAKSDVRNNLVREQKRREDRTPKHTCPRFVIVSADELKHLRKGENKRKQAQATINRKKGAEKRAKRAADRVARGLPAKKFITCPTCDAKSKMLRSEMGGVQTRTCQNGHHFEIDTWGGMNFKRRVERTDRPFMVFNADGTPGNYTDYIYGKYKNDPAGKQDK